MEIESSIQRMLEALNQKASNLSPKIIPKGYEDEDLLSLCKSEDRKNKLKELINSHKKNRSSLVCPLCKDENKTAAKMSTFWHFDLTQKQYKLDKIEFLCEDCHSLRDLEKFLELSNSNTNKKNLEKLIKHWATVNQFDASQHKLSSSANKKDDLSSSDSEDEKQTSKGNGQETVSELLLKDQIQQTYSLAYSLKVLMSNVGPLKVVDKEGTPITASVELDDLITKYFKNEAKQKSKNKKQEEKKTPNGKSKATKQPENTKGKKQKTK